MKRIEVPDLVQRQEVLVIVSISGGKDSTAVALALLEAGVIFRLAFADTGWEAPETYAHLRGELAEKLGPIDWVGVAGGMVAKVRARAGFPARMQRWCTRELKVEPLRAYHDRLAAEDGRETVSVLGIRAEESAERAKLPIWEDSDLWGGFVWRPIRDWSIGDVLAIHHRHGVRVNPLYQRGHERVGCFPCIYARKEEIRLIAAHAPERIAEIDALEREVTEERARRNVETPGRYTHPVATYFQAREVARRDEHGHREFDPMPIGRVVEWARSERGGKQLRLIQPEPEGGCFRWGMCEPPAKEAA